MGQALYRKYRSRNLSEIVGQEHITKTLDSALKSGKISHAYLFTGPRGVGKTSVARILAHEVNELPYEDESVHLDIIEIDAASNRRIDEIRDLRDKVHIAPTSAKFKVYIIDEVHMLTKEAFNALLKTLEEPPAHVIFILATTELHKLPDTIISRTQRFTFKPVEVKKAISHLKSLAEQESIEIDDEALELIAEQSNGSFRDSISMLDQIRHSSDKITKSDAEKLIGIANSQVINIIIDSTLNGSPASIVEALDDLIDAGVNPAQASRQIAYEIRKLILDGNDSSTLLVLLGDLLNITNANSTIHQLEIALFKANLANKPIGTANIVFEAPEVKIKARVDSEKPSAKHQEPSKVTLDNKTKNSDSNIIVTPMPGTDWWPAVLKRVKSVNNTLYGVLRMAVPEIEKDTITLSFAFDFHRKKAADAATLAKIQEIILEITGQNYSVNPVHNKTTKSTVSENKPKKQSPKKESNDNLDKITNIFGGGEILES